MSLARSIVLAGLLVVAGGSAAAGQLVPEGVHRDAQGPAHICGILGQNALDLIRQVTASAMHRKVTQTERFEFYISADEMDQWVFTRAEEPAHPAVTCRHVFSDETGNVYQTRDMRCDASRDACDRLFLEFQSLDDQLRRSFE